MTPTQEARFPRGFSLAVVFCALLAAASGAAAQKQEVVYSMTPNEAWPKMGTRVDGKLPAISFTFGTESAGAAGARTVAAQDAVLTIPAGEPAALWWRAALTMRHLAFVLIEFPLAVPKPPARAPFAIRLSDVVVTSVQLSKHSEDNRGSGTVEVKLRPARIEVFTATQDASGAVKPGPQFNWDFNKHSQF